MRGEARDRERGEIYASVIIGFCEGAAAENRVINEWEGERHWEKGEKSGTERNIEKPKVALGPEKLFSSLPIPLVLIFSSFSDITT